MKTTIILLSIALLFALINWLKRYLGWNKQVGLEQGWLNRK